MSILSGLLGNATLEDIKIVQQEYKHIFITSEKVERSYKLIRDRIVFTNLRLILINVQGLTGSKVEFHSIPYKNITHYSVETAGTLDLDSELKIWISGSALPHEVKFKKGNAIFEVYNAITEYVIK